MPDFHELFKLITHSRNAWPVVAACACIEAAYRFGLLPSISDEWLTTFRVVGCMGLGALLYFAGQTASSSVGSRLSDRRKAKEREELEERAARDLMKFDGEYAITLLWIRKHYGKNARLDSDPFLSKMCNVGLLRRGTEAPSSGLIISPSPDPKEYIIPDVVWTRIEATNWNDLLSHNVKDRLQLKEPPWRLSRRVVWLPHAATDQLD